MKDRQQAPTRANLQPREVFPYPQGSKEGNGLLHQSEMGGYRNNKLASLAMTNTPIETKTQ